VIADVQESIRQALWHLDNRIWLGECPLAALPCVAAAARTPEYRRRFFAEGLVIRDRLRSLLCLAVDDYGPDNIIGALAQARLDGRDNAEVARHFGFTQEHVCRKYFRDLVRAVAEKFCNCPDLAVA